MGQRGLEDKVARWADWRAIAIMETRRAALWVPACLGAGISLYFALPREPHWAWAWGALLPLGIILSGMARRGGAASLMLSVALFSAWAGFGAAIFEAQRVAAPVLAVPVDETVDGRVIGRSQSASGAPRVLLDRLTIYGLPADKTPARVRIALIETDLADAPQPGARIRVYARLHPPGGPVEPGGFDFARKAYFERLGGVGYAQSPPLPLGRAEAGGPLDRAWLWLAEARIRLADGLRARIPGPEGAFAAAIIAGDRAGIAEADAEALRASNLSHLLAISGLHMGILTGLVFAVARLAMAAIPGVALRLPAKKLAALAGLLAGCAYLALSGATVATQRAFIMAAVVFIAVMLDRPAITLRALAVAAVIILLIHPISLLDVGFQMSFAATTALVASYEAIRRASAEWRPAGGGLARRAARTVAFYACGVALSSLVAGLATAPFAAFHFDRLAPYGLPANLAAVPAMGLWIAPSAIAAAVLAPFGWAEPALAAMGWGIAWVLTVAREVASWPGAYAALPAAPPMVLPLIALGGLWLAVWRSWVRMFGLAPVVCALALWGIGAPRAEVLIAPGGRLVGVLGPEGRAVDHARAQSFAARTWLERDGAPADQALSAERPGLSHGRGWARAVLPNGWTLEVIHGRSPEPADLVARCRERVILVARHGGEVDGPCLYVGSAALERGGALAIHAPEGTAPRLVWARDVLRQRPWAVRSPADR